MSESTDKRPLHEAPADEQELDAYLKGDSSVSRHYRQLLSAEVPAELDRLVLRQAEEAVKRRRPVWVRWTAPLAVAASAVIVLSIVVESGVSEKAVLYAPQATIQAEEAAPSEPAARGSMPPGGIATQPATEALRDRHDLRNAAPPPPKLETPAPPPGLKAPAPQVPPLAEPAAEPPNAIPQSAAARDARNEAVEKARDAWAEVARTRSAAPVSAPAPAPAPKIMPVRSVSRAAAEAERVLASSLEEAEQKKTAAADQMRRAQQGAAIADSQQVSAELPEAPPAYTDPEAWLKDIRELRKANKHDEADREWRRFRAAFPNYEVAETDSAREAKQ